MIAPTPAPTLVTARLTLAMPVPSDLEESAAMWAEPAVYAMIGGRAFTREEIWQRLLRYIGHWQAIGYGTWYIRETDGGRFVGEVSLMDSRRATDPVFEGIPEAGWALATHAHGKGYAHEAMAAMLAWADSRPIPRPIARTVCIIDPANAASIRLAGKLGYKLLSEASYRDSSTLLFERIASR